MSVLCGLTRNTTYTHGSATGTGAAIVRRSTVAYTSSPYTERTEKGARCRKPSERNPSLLQRRLVKGDC